MTGSERTAPSPLSGSLSKLDVEKGLARKLAWAVGTTFVLDYNRRTEVQRWAENLAARLVQGHVEATGS